MKKLLFVLAFAFIGQQSFSQMYIVTITDQGNCPNNELTMSTIYPSGNVTNTCIPIGYSARLGHQITQGLAMLN